VRHLADWGADVIKIEPLSSSGEDVTGKRDGFDFQNLHRAKRILQLDLKTPEGHAVFMRLSKNADVLVENMRSSVKYRLKVSWEDLSKVNPRLVYGSISGFGQTGPYKDRPGVDQIAQGMSGLMSVTGEPGRGPMRVGVAVGDTTAGSYLAMGIAVALFDRERTGKGRWVQTSLLESLIYLMDFQAARWLNDKVLPRQVGNEHPQGVPTGVYPSSDGYFNIAAPSTNLWLHLCDALGKPEWKERKEWHVQTGRRQSRQEINSAIAETTRTRTTAEWMTRLEEAGVPCGPVYTVDQVFADPQVRHLGMPAPVVHPRLGQQHLVASPISFSDVPRAIRAPTPDPEQHTAELMKELGYTTQELDDLKARNVLR
jgi:formyl-CoA transferase